MKLKNQAISMAILVSGMWIITKTNRVEVPLYVTGLGTLAVLAASFAVPAVLEMRDLKKEQKKIDEDRAVKRFEEFYDECQKYGIDSLKNPGSAEKKQRMELLAKKYQCDLANSAIYQQFDDLHREKTQQKIEKEAQVKEEEKRKEQEQYERLIHYAQFHGTDKPVAMFKDMMGGANVIKLSDLRARYGVSGP